MYRIQFNSTSKMQIDDTKNVELLQKKLNLLEKRLNNPKVDLFETNRSYIIRMELNVENYKYELQEGQIVLVTSEKLCNYERRDNIKVLYKECRYGKIMRRVKLPFKVHNKAVSESYDKGILTLEFTKKLD